MNNKRKLMVNLIASIVVFIVQFVINFGLSPFIIEKLGEEAYGFITLANNFTQYATLIAVAINSMAGRFISIEYNKGNKESANKFFASVFWINVIFSVIILIISLLIVFHIEQLININDDLVHDVKVTFALSFCNLIISFLSISYITTTFVTNRMDLHAYTQICANIMKMLLIVGAFTLMSPKIYFVSLGTAISTLFIFIIYLYWKQKLIPFFSISIQEFELKKIIILAKSGFWVLISNISSLLLNGMDLLIANLIISQIAMGRLSISKQLPSAISGLLGFLSNIFAASFTILIANNNKDELVNEIGFTCRVLGMFLTVPFSGIIVYGIDFFTLWLPGSIYNFNEIKEIYILMILTLSNVIVNAYMYSIHSLFIALDKVKIYSIMIFISGIISIIATLLLTYLTPLGIYAIAGTSTVVLCFVNFLLVPLYAEYVINVPYFSFIKIILKNYFALGITSLTFLIFKRILNFDTWPYFLLSAIFVGGVGYIIDFFILLNKAEKTRLFDIVGKKWGGVNKT